MKKIKFPKKEKKIDVADLGMDYPGVIMWVWDDPNATVCNDMLKAILTADDDLDEEITDKFFEAITRYIIRSNVEGLNFDTVDKTIESFSHPDLSWGFLYEFSTLEIGRLLEENRKLKKALKVPSSNQTSGKSNNDKEKE